MREANLDFNFGASWRILKYDEDGGFYKTKMDKNIKPTKAVDFIGISQNQQPLLLMEVKDFSLGVPHREKFDKLPLTVATKARDTVAGIVGGSYCASDAVGRTFFTNSRQKLDVPPRVVFLFLDLNTPQRRDLRRTLQKRDVLLKKLKQHLSWLTRDITVVGLDDYQTYVPDLNVRHA